LQPAINNPHGQLRAAKQSRVFPVILTQINSPYLSPGTKAGLTGITVYETKGQRIIDGVFLMTRLFVS
jgi:hypothetical protein